MIYRMKRKVIEVFVIILLLVALVCYGCPFYKLLGILCPACGTTRAWLSFLSGNFKKAFEYNMFFAFYPPFILFAFLPKKTKLLSFALIAFAITVCAFNVLRWFGMFAIPL